jgi:AraC-like DNA-binding protein/ligand-binding sensor protein
MEEAQTALSGALKQEFQKDLELFKHFLLLLNNAGPIRNVELMWNEELDPSKPRFKNRVGTEDALVQLQPAGSAGNRNSPSALFCDLVHGYGTHEEETCARSDVPAQQRCRSTGCTQVYPCHVGLTDIAVPVMCDGEYLGTLFSGQVLTQPPTPEGWAFVKKSLGKQPHIDFANLEAAYYGVPVVDQAQLAEMVRVLELFARYIANSWKRLKIMSEFQRTQDRQLALDRKELAAILLSGELGGHQELRALAERAGLKRLPDHVLVVQLEHPGVSQTPVPQISDQMTLNRLTHLVEDSCQGWSNTLAMVVRPGELCIFTSQETRNRAHERLSLQEIAESLVGVARSRGGATARIGISAAHAQPAELISAYHEACSALGSGAAAISFFEDPAKSAHGPAESLERLVKAIRQGSDTTSTLREFLAHAVGHDHSAGRLQESRAFLTWAIEHLALEMTGIGAEPAALQAAKEQAIAAVLHAPSPFSACDAFRRFADFLASQIASTFSDREHKIVLAVCQFVEERGVAQLSIQEIAQALRLSTGHLGRIFRRSTGMTLESFLIRQRVELAKRKLLDPRLNVAEVAERCGFCNPAYFASVFKKYVNCTPREYARQPRLWAQSSSSPAGMHNLSRQPNAGSSA